MKPTRNNIGHLLRIFTSLGRQNVQKSTRKKKTEQNSHIRNERSLKPNFLWFFFRFKIEKYERQQSEEEKKPKGKKLNA